MSGRYEDDPRGDGVFRTVLFGLVALAAVPTATLAHWIPGGALDASPAIALARSAALIAFVLIILVWELIARGIYLERAEDQATNYDENKRDRGLSALPKLARQQSSRHIAIVVLAALSFVTALDAMSTQPWVSAATMLIAVLGVVVVLWSRLFPVERIISRAFSVFRKHLEDTVRGTLVNGVHGPVHSEIVVDRNRVGETEAHGGVLSNLTYLVVVVVATAAVLAGGYFGLQNACSTLGVACNAAGNAHVLMQGIDIP